MRSKLSHYIPEILSAVFFSVLLAYLAGPWIDFLTEFTVGEGNASGTQHIWMFFYVFLSIYLLKLSNKYNKMIWIFITVIPYMVLNSILIYMFQWPMYIFCPMLFLLLFAASRFRSYVNSDRLYTDTALGLLLFLINLGMSGRTGFALGYADIVFFFLLTFLFVITTNAGRMQKIGYPPKYKLIFTITTVFFIAIILGAAILDSHVQSSLIKLLTSGVKFVYGNITAAMLFLLSLFLRLIGPLMEWFTERFSSGQDGSQEPLELELESNHNWDDFERGKNPMYLSIPDFVYWIIFCMVLACITYLIIRRIKKIRLSADGSGYVEERRSIFSVDELKVSFKELLSRISKPFEAVTRRYGSDHVMQIRRRYRQLLQKTKSMLLYRTYQTPTEYAAYLLSLKESKLNKESVDTMTLIYNKARYGDTADMEDVRKATEIINELSGIERSAGITRDRKI